MLTVGSRHHWRHFSCLVICFYAHDWSPLNESINRRSGCPCWVENWLGSRRVGCVGRLVTAVNNNATSVTAVRWTVPWIAAAERVAMRRLQWKTTRQKNAFSSSKWSTAYAWITSIQRKVIIKEYTLRGKTVSGWLVFCVFRLFENECTFISQFDTKCVKWVNLTN